MRALYAAATGMAAQELNVQVISNNIANLRTTGYKRQQVHFQDLLYQNLRRSGSSTSDQNTILPAGLALGSGVKTTSTARAMTQGPLAQTEKDYDVAIRGEGFFLGLGFGLEFLVLEVLLEFVELGQRSGAFLRLAKRVMRRADGGQALGLFLRNGGWLEVNGQR